MSNDGNGLERIIDDILSGEFGTREKAERELKRTQIDQLSGIQLLKAAARVPADKREEVFGRGMVLVEAAAQLRSDDYYSVILSEYLNYEPGAQGEVIRLLVDDGSETGLATIGEIVRKTFSEADFNAYPGTADLLSETEAAANLPFVEWMNDALGKGKSTGIVVPSIVLGHIQRGWVAEDRQLSLRSGLEVRIKQLADDIDKVPAGLGNSWRAADQYVEVSEQLELLIDLYGSGPTPPSFDLTQRLLGLGDPWLRYWVVRSMLKHGLPVKPEVLKSLAESPETRGSLFETVQEFDCPQLFPERFKSQRDLAESNLVRWLTYPTELSAVPDEIEFLRRESTGIFQKQDTYFFKFRTYPPHWAADDGWMIGWSGPFTRGKLETHGSETFSEFEKVI